MNSTTVYVVSVSPVVGDIIAVLSDRAAAIALARDRYFSGDYGTLLIAVTHDDVPASTQQICYLPEYE